MVVSLLLVFAIEFLTSLGARFLHICVVFMPSLLRSGLISVWAKSNGISDNESINSFFIENAI